MFKKLKEKIEAGDEGGGGGLEKVSVQPWRPPGSAVRSPPGQDELKTFVLSPKLFPGSALTNLGSVTSTGASLSVLPEQYPTDEDAVDSVKDGSLEESGAKLVVNSLPLEMKHTQKEQEQVRKKQEEQASDLQGVLSELSSELSTLRIEYEQLDTNKKKQAENLKRVIAELKEELEDKNKENKKLGELVASQKQELEQLSSRLKAYSEHSEGEMIEALQQQIKELENNLRESEREILVAQTRLASQSRRFKEDQEQDVQKMLSMGSTIASLEETINAKDNRLTALTGEVHELRVALAEKEENVSILTTALDVQTRELKELKEQMDKELRSHADQIEQLKFEQRVEVDLLQEQLKELRNELQDREAQLERMVRELPDLPVTRAVLDGYSRSHMLESLPLGSFPSPGGVYRKNAEPLTPSATTGFELAPFPSPNAVHSNGTMHNSQHKNSNDDLGSEESNGDLDSPAILPSSVYSSMPVESLEGAGERTQKYSSPYTGQFSTIHTVVQELRKENKRMEELLASKGKTIRLQQQNISDMKKTLSRELAELKAQTSVDASPNHPISQPHFNFLSQSQSHSAQFQTPPQVPSDMSLTSVFQSSSECGKTLRESIGSDVNFQYLKNVVIRFICSKEDEAYQLIRAVSTLLELSKSEEKYMRDYLEYKRSWFGSMPRPPFTPFSQ